MEKIILIKESYIYLMEVLLTILLLAYIIQNGDYSSLIIIVLCYALIMFADNFIIRKIIKKSVEIFSLELSGQLDQMLRQENPPLSITQNETWQSHIENKLQQLYIILQVQKHQVTKEKKNIEELISHISHQIKGPLANIQVITETLAEEAFNKQSKDFINILDLQVQKLTFLANTFIKTSHLETGSILPVRENVKVINTVGDALSNILIPAEQKKIKIVVSCPADLIGYYDSKWTTEAISNLLDNAVKYTDTGGTIKILVCSMDSHIKFQVIDNGRGIDEKYHSFVFQRFFREPDVHAQDGAGLGLYLTREILSLQGATIRLESQPQKGSVFTIFFPK